MIVVAGHRDVFVVLDEGVDHEEGVGVKVIMLLANHVSFVTWKIRDSKPFNRLKDEHDGVNNSQHELNKTNMSDVTCLDFLSSKRHEFCVHRNITNDVQTTLLFV